MSKKVRRICLLSIAVVIFACLSSACGGNPVRLDTPCNFVFENRIVSWDKVENAVKYAVFFEGKEYEVQDNKFNTLDVTIEEKEYAIEVVAVGDEKDYADSEWGTFNFEITAPIELKSDKDGFLYTLNTNKTGYIFSRGYADLTGVIKVPEYFDGLPVTDIGCIGNVTEDTIPDPFTDFACNTETTGIILPSTLTFIGSSVFQGLVNVKEIIIPDSVTSIGSRAFDGCISLEKVVLPKNLKVIQSECFANCALKEVILPDGLETIESAAFRCETRTGFDSQWTVMKHTEQNFTKIVIPDSVKEIGNEAFYGCKMLKDVTLSKNLEHIGDLAFGDTAWYDSKPDGAIILCNVLYDYKGDIPGGTLVVPDGIVVANFDRMCRSETLKAVVLPKSLKWIMRNLPDVVFYKGDFDDWQSVQHKEIWLGVRPFREPLHMYYYSETKPVGEGNYWHYVDGEVTKW